MFLKECKSDWESPDPSNTEEAFKKLERKLNSWILQAKENKDLAEEDCSNCYCLCQILAWIPAHFSPLDTFCQECVMLFLDQVVLPSPLSCPLNCSTPVVARHTVKHGT